MAKNLKDKLNLIFSVHPSQFVNTKYKWSAAGANLPYKLYPNGLSIRINTLALVLILRPGDYTAHQVPTYPSTHLSYPKEAYILENGVPNEVCKFFESFYAFAIDTH